MSTIVLQDLSYSKSPLTYYVVLQSSLPQTQVKSTTTLQPIFHEWPINNFEFGQCSQNHESSSSDDASPRFSSQSKNLKKPQLNVSDVVSPKSQAKLALKKEIRSRREKRETKVKNKNFKKQVEMPNKKNFGKPTTAKNFQNHTTIDGSNERETTVTKSFRNNFAKSEKQVRSLSQKSLTNLNWKGILPTPKLSKSLLSVTKLNRRTRPLDKTFSSPKTTPTKQTFSSPKTNTIKHTLRTCHKENVTSFKPMTKYGVWINEKNLAFGFYPLESHVSSNLLALQKLLNTLD